MTEILPGIHQVDGEGRSPDDTHVFLVKDGNASSWTMIDTGFTGADAPVLAYLKRQRLEPKSVRQILLTHLHRDHVGSLERLATATGARTFAHWIEAAFIAGDPKYDGPGMPPEKAFEVSERLKDGDHLDAGGGLEVLHTPGHTPGHVGYYQRERKILFCGDLFFMVGSKIVLTTPQYTLHTPTAQVSARRVGTLGIDALLGGHGAPITSGAGARVADLLKRL